MQTLGTKTVDELGRAIVPKEVRQLKGWKAGDKITFCNYNGIIVLEPWDKVNESALPISQALQSDAQSEN